MNPTCFHAVLRLALLAAWLGVGSGVAGRAAPPRLEGADRDYLVQNWQTDEGLPRNSITSLAQDSRGYLWLGTPYGLVRFDGDQFLSLAENVSPALARGSVQQVFCGPEDELWVGTRRSGLLRYAESFPGLVEKSFPSGGAVESIAQDRHGEVWVTSGNGLLGRITNGTLTPVSQLGHLASGPMQFALVTDARGGMWFCKQDTYGQLMDGQPTNVTTYAGSVITLAPSHDGGLWLSTGNNLRRLAPGSTATTEITLALPFGLYGISALYEDRAGTLWLGAAGNALYRLVDGKLKQVEGVHHRVSDLLEDAEGNLWVGTDGGGLFKIRPRVFKLTGKREGLAREDVVSVSGDWVAPQGGGVGRLLPSGEFEGIAEFQTNSIASVLDDGAGGMWFGTVGGRLFHRFANGEHNPPVYLATPSRQLRVLHRDGAGNLWIGGFPSGLFRLNAGEETRWNNFTARGFGNAPVTAITHDAAGDVWIGTSAGKLHRYHGDEFSEYSAGLSRFAIGALLPATNGGLWIGTLGGGLGFFRDGRARFLGVEAGLLDNVITQLIADEHGWLWVGCSRGLARVRTADLLAVLEGEQTQLPANHFGRTDGLPNIQCATGHQPSAWLTTNGELRFATSQGVITFNPAAIPMNLRPPPLNLERVELDGVPLDNRTALQLAHDYKKLEFYFTAISYVAPEKVLFQCRLSNFDEDWVELGTKRSVSYPRLLPGQYEFQFTACNNDGVWNEQPFALKFEVRPAFWQRAWFRGLAVLIFAALVAGVARYISVIKLRRKLARAEQAHALERERARIARDLHDDLGARLTQMAFLTDLAAGDVGASGEVKTQLADVSQQARSAVQSLDETVWTVNPQKDSLPHLIGYLASYAEQFFRPTGINLRLEICPHPPAHPLPGNLRHEIFLLVKEALNNTLKHSGANEVWLRVAVRGPVLRIVIRDNGSGFAASDEKPLRHGLENMRRRAAEAGLKLKLNSAPGQGTKLFLRVTLPVTRKP